MSIGLSRIIQASSSSSSFLKQTNMKMISRGFSDLMKEYANEISDIEKSYEDKAKRKQAKVGTVVSAKNAKSISVEIEYFKYFPKYDVKLRRTRKIMAHDAKEEADIGDVVRIVPCRPMSKMKRHQLIDIIKRPVKALNVHHLSDVKKEEEDNRAQANSAEAGK